METDPRDMESTMVALRASDYRIIFAGVRAHAIRSVIHVFVSALCLSIKPSSFPLFLSLSFSLSLFLSFSLSLSLSIFLSLPFYLVVHRLCAHF